MGKTFKVDSDSESKFIKRNTEPKVCPDCNGFGYIKIGEIIEECPRCEGTGEIE
jgi:DnaJ-class molecular chaperone